MTSLFQTLPCWVLGGVFAFSSCRRESTPSDESNASQQSSAVVETREDRPSALNALADPSVPIELRIKRARALTPNSLTKIDRETLYHFFDHRPLHEDPQAWAAVFNEVMNFLTRTGLEGQRLTPALTRLLQDETAPVVLRDYALQHLASWSNDLGDHTIPSEKDSEKRLHSWQFIGQTVTDPSLQGTSLPATALRTLSYYVQDRRTGGVEDPYAAVLTPKLNGWINQAVRSGERISQTMRARALEAAGLMQLDNLHPAVRELAQQETISEDLRLAAIAALSNYQNPDDLGFFKSLARSDSRLRYAASQALKRHRLPQ